MKLPISDMMDTCTAEDIALAADINTEAVKAKTLARIHAEPTRRHWKPSVLLAAAIVATLLFGTAVASGSTIVGHYVDDSSEATQRFIITETDGSIRYVEHKFPNASYAIRFDFEEAQEGMVYYKVNQLPYPAHDPWPKPVDSSGWLPYWTVIENDGYYTDPERPYRRNGEMLYQVRVTPLANPDLVYYFNGEVLSEKYDIWQGMSRLRLSIDYANSEHYSYCGVPVNYLILMDPDRRVMVYIAGTSEFNVLEAIAENMEIKVTDEVDTRKEFEEEWTKGPPSNVEYLDPDVSWLDLGRG